MSKTIKLDRKEIEEKVAAGDGCNGGYVLATDGTAARVYWAERNRQWDPWPDGWITIGIPALDPDGSGCELEDAQDMLKLVLSADEYQQAKERADSGDIGWVDLAEELAEEDWKIEREEAASWLADAFLAACNGYGEELNDLAPWGYEYNEFGETEIEREPPAEFDWA